MSNCIRYCIKIRSYFAKIFIEKANRLKIFECEYKICCQIARKISTQVCDKGIVSRSKIIEKGRICNQLALQCDKNPTLCLSIDLRFANYLKANLNGQ